MKGIKRFEEFIGENIVKKQGIDKSRAEFLIKEAENSYNNLSEMLQKIYTNILKAKYIIEIMNYEEMRN